MLIPVIQVKDYENAKQQLQLAQGVDGVELRLDYAISLNIAEIAALRNEFRLPMIFTLRKKSQGGFYKYSEAQRLQDILALCQLQPDYVDLEYDVPREFLQHISSFYPAIKLICSYHNFEETPGDLANILQSLQCPVFYAYKIATKANTSVDALRMLDFIHSQHGVVLTGLCMGELGECTRILGRIVGNAMNYACIDQSRSTAPGQLTLNDLLTVYHFRQLNKDTKIYVLLGDPVNLSVGHVLHNQVIRYLQKNAVYIKLKTTQQDLANVLQLCRRLPVAGCSITMPLKEVILPYLDGIEADSMAMGAINTIVKVENKFLGFNTDGAGAITALKKRLSIGKQTIAILGAGGAARSIAYVAMQGGADVIVLNRTCQKAKQLANDLGCKALPLDALIKLDYTVLINTLPESAYLHLKELLRCLRPHTIAMDIVYQPTKTQFLHAASTTGCAVVPGYEMYIHQAMLQLQRWFDLSNTAIGQIKMLLYKHFESR